MTALRARALLNCMGLILTASAVLAPAALAQTGGATPGSSTTTTPATTTPATPTPKPTTTKSCLPPGSSATSATGGAGANIVDPNLTLTVAGSKAKMLDCGLAAAPVNAPDPVKQAIWAANEIIGKPYKYGGGHNLTFRAKGYDCSGTVSYALHGAGLLDTPLDSGKFMKWGEKGKGAWITVYTNPGHAYTVIAGLRLDTSAANDKGARKGPRWRPKPRPAKGFKSRHPVGY